MTLALPKAGLLTDTARPYVGDLYLADIHFPMELYKQTGVNIKSIFENDTMLAL